MTDNIPVTRRSRFSISILISTLALIAALSSATCSYLIWRKLKPAIDEVGWAELVNADTAAANRIAPQVGTIQFLKNGFSIQLENVRYDSNGLVLEGFVGNPTNLWVSNLTLEFHAKQSAFSVHDKFILSPPGSFERLFLWVDDIGSGQTTPIASLAPGSRERFLVTIPNVKQSKDSVDLRVGFTGERYNYLK